MRKRFGEFALVAFWGAMISCVTLPDGKKVLSPAAESAVLQGELSLCDALLPLAAGAAVPALGPAAATAGAMSPYVCQGSELLMKKALDKVSAKAAPASAPDAGPVATPLPLLKTAKGYAVFAGTKQIGTVPSAALAAACHSPEVQAALAEVPLTAPSASPVAPSASASAPAAPPPPAASALPAPSASVSASAWVPPPPPPVEPIKESVTVAPSVWSKIKSWVK